MTSLSGIQPSLNQTSLLSEATSAPSTLDQAKKKSPELKEAFQDFVAGTFYKQMFKSLRSAQNKPAYFHGGQAEEMFQAQLDQQISEDLAKGQGSAFSDTLFSAFSRQMNAQSVKSLESAPSVIP
ncbi:flagellar rod assembly protein/muramidase FlgJ [Gimesia alba]|uniref:Flagellar rod assembly protein/muramidase FlgJ n=1 Tax=Gimesia alba TaxID=2527973 RepID=A0A517RAD6_9PLAN|nr:rod-binding protein [Gimesia alba]QDT40854.1 flagellar rod assembly protein/muramidase FlgJ [Gimesia alba]